MHTHTRLLSLLLIMWSWLLLWACNPKDDGTGPSTGRTTQEETSESQKQTVDHNAINGMRSPSMYFITPRISCVDEINGQADERGKQKKLETILTKVVRDFLIQDRSLRQPGAEGVSLQAEPPILAQDELLREAVLEVLKPKQDGWEVGEGTIPSQAEKKMAAIDSFRQQWNKVFKQKLEKYHGEHTIDVSKLAEALNKSESCSIDEKQLRDSVSQVLGCLESAVRLYKKSRQYKVGATAKGQLEVAASVKKASGIKDRKDLIVFIDFIRKLTEVRDALAQ